MVFSLFSSSKHAWLSSLAWELNFLLHVSQTYDTGSPAVCLFSCRLTLLLSLNLLSQILHWNFFRFNILLVCLVKSSLLGNTLSQWSHGYNLILEFPSIRLCLSAWNLAKWFLNLNSELNFSPQKSHSHLYWTSCPMRWWLRRPRCLKAAPHTSQTYGCSWEWFLMCCCRFGRLRNVLPQPCTHNSDVKYGHIQGITNCICKNIKILITYKNMILKQWLQYLNYRCLVSDPITEVEYATFYWRQSKAGHNPCILPCAIGALVIIESILDQIAYLDCTGEGLLSRVYSLMVHQQCLASKPFPTDLQKHTLMGV